MDKARILKPLQRAEVLAGASPLFHLIILKFLVLFSQLPRNGVKALLDARLVRALRIFSHIAAIGVKQITLLLQHQAHVVRCNKGIHNSRHSSDCRVLKQELMHPSV